MGRNEPASGLAAAPAQTRFVITQAALVGNFIIGIIVGIVIVIFVLVQCTRAIF